MCGFTCFSLSALFLKHHTLILIFILIFILILLLVSLQQNTALNSGKGGLFNINNFQYTAAELHGKL